MVAGHDVQVKAPIHSEDGKIEHMDSSACLGSVVSSNGRIDAEIDMHIANASMVFGALHHAVFNDRNLTTSTKRQVYECQLAAIADTQPQAVYAALFHGTKNKWTYVPI